jgi:endonuclease YncB( thermonuclease family)
VERLSFYRRSLLALAALAAGAAVTTVALSPDDASAAARKRAPARAKVQAPECPTAGSRTVVFAKALTGTSFATQDGQEVRLAGVMAPGEGGETAAPAAADAARQALTGALKAGPVTLASADAADRYGRIVAQVFAGGAWVQGAMLNSGAVRVSPERASAPCMQQLAQAEDSARTVQAGHWRDGGFALRNPEELRARVGSFQVVEGEVTTASTNKGRAYTVYWRKRHSVKI